MKNSVRTIYSTFKYLLKAGIPNHILVFGASLGDNLLLTVLARELHRRGAKNIWIKCDYPELYLNNPYIQLVLPFHTLWSTTLLKLLSVKISYLAYSAYDRATDGNTIPEKHIVLKMADCLGLKGPISVRPDFYLSGDEARAGLLSGPQIAITVSNVDASSPVSNKDWINERYQQLVDRFGADYHFIQLGSVNDYGLQGVTDLRGKTTIRQSAAILSRSALLISYAGFTMHLARSVDCPAVIIYGGRELPVQTGYRAFFNVTLMVPCAPCWLNNRCDFAKQCMTGITAAEVIEVIQAALLKEPPLPDELLTND